MEPLLAVAEELERRDARAAEALGEVERHQADVRELRAQASAIAAFLERLPAAFASSEAEARAAAEARVGAEAALRAADSQLERARRGDERLAAERAAQRARDDIDAAEHRLERARAERARLEEEGGVRRSEAKALEGRSVALAARAKLDPPTPGLGGIVEWASRARGELLVGHAELATERDTVVREASELVASVLGEPLPPTGVAGVRDRLERALSRG